MKYPVPKVGLSITQLPTKYSDSDEQIRRELLIAIDALQREYQQKAQTYIDRLSEIESRYAPRYVLMNTPVSAEKTDDTKDQ